ncbi:MAG: four helix bundle protein [Bacteroidaceae bacterium]|nr:four helix bundle protein [Bacteroidaceae bacterium]
MTHDNLLYDLSKAFALRIIKLNRYLREEKHEFMMSHQIYKSGTSIGANVSESMHAQSRADFISKLEIALKEARETKYWLELLQESGTIEECHFASIANDNNILIGTITNIVKKTKEGGDDK